MPTSQVPREDAAALQLLDALLRRRIDPGTVTATQAVGLERWCAKTRKKRQRKVERLLSQGRRACAMRAQVVLWRSPAALLDASFKAERNEARQLRSRGVHPHPYSFARVWDRSERLRNDFAPSQAVPRIKRKRIGSRRYYAFNVFGMTKQILFVNAVKPFADFHSSQTLMNGGRSAACEKLLGYANEGPLLGRYFVKADVRTYYDAISHRYLEEMLPAPKAIIRNTLLLHGWGGGVAMDQRGIPQGSAASSLVGEMMIADVLRSAADALPAGLISYADDIGGLVPLRADAIALAERLTHAFETHGAGPFSLVTHVLPAGGPFRFLGYEFAASPDGQEVVANAPPGVANERAIELANEFSEASTAEELMLSYRRLQGLHSAYHLAEDVHEVVVELLDLLRGILASRPPVGERSYPRPWRERNVSRT